MLNYESNQIRIEFVCLMPQNPNENQRPLSWISYFST